MLPLITLLLISPRHWNNKRWNFSLAAKSIYPGWYHQTLVDLFFDISRFLRSESSPPTPGSSTVHSLSLFRLVIPWNPSPRKVGLRNSWAYTFIERSQIPIIMVLHVIHLFKGWDCCSHFCLKFFLSSGDLWNLAEICVGCTELWNVWLCNVWLCRVTIFFELYYLL